MLKKVMLGIVALILLVGAENLLAKEKEEQGKSKAKQKQKQVQKETKRQKSKAKQLAKKKADKQTAPKRRKASQKKRREKVTKEAEAVKARAEKAKAAASARKRMEQVHGKGQQLRPGANLPRQQMFSRWLDELTIAYRENDREKMGQLIRKMHQLRQRVRKAMSAPVEAGRDLRARPKATPPKVTDRPSRRKPPERIDRPSAERRREGTDRRRRSSPEPKRPEP